MKPNEIFLHPDWDGVIEHGNNAAILYFREPIGVDVPTLADRQLSLEKIDMRLALRSGNATRMAFCHAGPYYLCPKISRLGPSSFCAFLPSSHEWQQGIGNKKYVTAKT